MPSSAPNSAASRADVTSMTTILIAGSIILALSFGIRSIFGGIITPLSAEFGWPRETYSLSLAIQNLAWGLAQPLFGAIADRYGDRKALWLGFFCYLAGMGLAVVGMTPFAQHMGSGLLIGMGIAGTAFGIVLSVVGRAAPEAKRSQYLGYATAAGSLGQVVLPPIAAWLLTNYDWRVTLIVLTVMLLPMAVCIPFLKANAPTPGSDGEAQAASQAQDEPGLGAVLARAFGYPSYLFLTLGFFVCGFHLAFISIHFPAFVAERCGDPALGLQALTLVGATNIIGTILAGQLGAWLPKQYLLSGIYALRALVIVIFISNPITPLSVILFSLAIGPLWLSTVPLTSGLVVAMFGPKHMGTLYGFVFLSHQLGSFTGVWLGGWLYDATGSYDIVWKVAIALGVLSAIVHLPVRERIWTPRQRAAV